MSFPYTNVGTASIVATTAAYAANQVIGGGINSLLVPNNGGFIQTVRINTNSTNGSQIDFMPFTSSMPNTVFTDHSSIAVSSVDFPHQGPTVNVTAWNYSGLNASNGVASGLAYAYFAPAGIMYFALVARGAVTLNSTNGISVSVTLVS